MPEVLVKDNEGSAIYSYSSTATALVLSDKATNIYKLNADMVSVEYASLKKVIGLYLTRICLQIQS